MSTVNGLKGLEGLVGPSGATRLAGVMRFVRFVGLTVKVFGTEFVFRRSADDPWLGRFVSVGLVGFFCL